MATDAEKRLLKEFMDGLETTKLCDVVRSVYHGGGVSVQSREDAEMLLLTQSATQIFSSKKVPITAMLKFLISKGLTPRSDMTKSDLCLAFKMLVENQPDYLKSPIQPSQMSVQPSRMPIQTTQMCIQPSSMPIQPAQMSTQQPTQMPIHPMQMSVQPGQIPFTIIPNHLMHFHPQIQQIPVMPTTAPGPKAKKDRENELLEDFIEMFAKQFYDLFNDIGVPGKNQLDGRHFYENCSMALRILGVSEEISEKCEDSASLLQCLSKIKKEHNLFLSPYLSEVKWKKETHGLVKVHIGGTLHQGVARLVGMFEQQFILREDPQAKNTWKILNTNLMMKSIESSASGPTLSIQGTQTNNLQIDI